mmetsp:Transcript_692/g.1675  ORF Transcript_692/g.1675 Transcript_692/m.1675 type:complete len:144 (-) Transcript_692:592-1023(-)
MLKTVSSLHSKRGTKPNTPTKKIEHEAMIKKSATFSRHACLASFVGLMMHLLGIGNVMIHAKELQRRPSTAALLLRWNSGSGTDAVARERLVMTVDWVPRDSLAHEYLALGTKAADPAMDLARDSKVRPPSSDTSSPAQDPLL